MAEPTKLYFQIQQRNLGFTCRDVLAVGNITSLAANMVTYTNTGYPSFATVQDALDYLLYTPLSVSLSGGSTNEIGQTVTSVALTWTLNKTVTSQSIDNGIGSLDVSARNYTHSGQSITSNRTYTITCSDGTTTDTASTTITFAQKRFWGTGTEPDLTAITDSTIRSWSSEFASSRTMTKTFDCTGGRYFYFSWPLAWGNATFKINGLSWSDYSYYVKTYENIYHVGADYVLYRPFYIQTGSAITVEVL